MLRRPFTKMSGCGPARIRLPCIGLVLLVASGALAASPLDTLRDFCRLDGGGARVQPRTWPQVARLVDWPLEPAWDRIVVISGYQLGTAREEDGVTSIPVTYSLVAEVRPGKVALSASLETYTYRLIFDPRLGSWRILGPPPAPHLFETEVDRTAMAAALDPGNGRFISNSAFVWDVLRERGWRQPYADTTALAELPELKPEDEPRGGDLAIFFDHRTPFHVGVRDEDGTIVSATLNGGVQRTEPGIFSTEVRYFRPSPDATPVTPGTDRPSTPTPGPAAPPARTGPAPGSAVPIPRASMRPARKSRPSTRRKKTPARKKRPGKLGRAGTQTPTPK